PRGIFAAHLAWRDVAHPRRAAQAHDLRHGRPGQLDGQRRDPAGTGLSAGDRGDRRRPGDPAWCARALGLAGLVAGAGRRHRHPRRQRLGVLQREWRLGVPGLPHRGLTRPQPSRRRALCRAQAPRLRASPMNASTVAAPAVGDRLVLVSHALCPYVQRAAIALREKGVPFERVDIDLSNKPAWFLALSPLGKTPVLLVPRNGHFETVFESAVICDFLDETIAPPLHPADALERARHRAWIEVASSTLNQIW